jgi:hypothetical protein
MQTTSSDSDVANFEDALSSITLASWNRVRSSEELLSFIDTRHAALADVEL